MHKFTAARKILFDVLNIDFIGPFPDGTLVLVVIDSFLRWTALFHCEDATTESAGRYLIEHCSRSDRGPRFTNELMEKFMLAFSTPHNITLASSKEKNSVVDRVNKEINRHLLSYIFETLEGDQHKLSIPFVQRIMNSSVHGSISVSPGDLHFGNRLDLKRGILMPFQQALPAKTPGSRIMADMIGAQDNVHSTVRERMQEDAALRLVDQPIPTVFPTGSYVLARWLQDLPHGYTHGGKAQWR